ncbi:hypothetical protein [Carboxylicivirga taeanensis]|uniref:hypothetical protein n=1 Tax=Carboxylicivirga taeanensis TaxID=1416875 RepID=UPI003F6E066E
MKIARLIIMLLVVPFCLHAQEERQDSIKITGVVFEKDSLTILPYSRFNLEMKDYASDERGQFSFWAHQGEVVRFSYMGFKDTYIQINDSLKHKNYLLGVFLSRDTIQISEVIVTPRFERLSLEAKTMPLVITPEMAYATNNVRSSTRQALTQAPLKMDAEMNQRMVLQERTWSTVYKTQIPPSQTVGVTSENLALMRLFMPQDEQKIQEITPRPLNRNELELILRIYEQRTQKALPIP